MPSLEIPEGFLAESLRIPWEIPLGIPLDSARNAKGILKDSLGNPMDSLGIPYRDSLGGMGLSIHNTCTHHISSL